MSLLVTVRIPHPLDEVQRIEQAHPQIMQPIIQAAMKYMASHRRVERDGEVMDLDEYVDEANYDRFFAEAGDAIRVYNELVGGGVHDVLWNAVSEPPPGEN
jgi:hypothetical protein